MPIRAEYRKFYTAAAGWPATRRRILERAGGRFDERGKYLGGAKCERCGKPDRTDVVRCNGKVFGTPIMFWSPIRAVADWRKEGWFPLGWVNHRGVPVDASAGVIVGEPRVIRVVLNCAHLNHVAGDDRDENLEALCQWDHLHLDYPHHKETRCRRKDAQRPLLAIA